MLTTPTPDNPLFCYDDKDPWTPVGEGVRRKVLTYDAQMMVVKVAFETGSIGPPHQHVHVQMSYVESGAFRVTVAGATRVLRAGDLFYAPSNVVHAVECLEAGVLLDTFHPMRADFV
ncbi:cupin domain-containing protein [Hymenobacter sp.]|uniref:cupin domain-containing protein n=1 Tax=Hymenobacter sp. TaxID=1898978 RepID=UPI00286C8C35|nr:cupin domain-containing protein [Hymenobacter sp.]